MQMTKSGTSERRATRLVFLHCGMAQSSWAPLVPYAKGFGVAYLLVLVALGLDCCPEPGANPTTGRIGCSRQVLEIRS